MAHINRRKKNRSLVIAAAVIAMVLITAVALMKSTDKTNSASFIFKTLKSSCRFVKNFVGGDGALEDFFVDGSGVDASGIDAAGAKQGRFAHMNSADRVDGMDSYGVVTKKMPSFSGPTLREMKVDVDFTELENDPDALKKMIKRKEAFGIKTGLDMVVRSNETFKLGSITISMRDILEKIYLKKGELFEEKIDDTGEIDQEKIIEYGIYVVQFRDNIWNIHYKIIKEFFAHRGVHVSEKADEPLGNGRSSGVGKLLKFSETTVFIYNLLEDSIDDNIDLLEPLSKVVIYNINEIFSLLDEIDFKHVDEIQFDGQAIWIPAKKLD